MNVRVNESRRLRARNALLFYAGAAFQMRRASLRRAANTNPITNTASLVSQCRLQLHDNNVLPCSHHALLFLCLELSSCFQRGFNTSLHAAQVLLSLNLKTLSLRCTFHLEPAGAPRIKLVNRLYRKQDSMISKISKISKRPTKTFFSSKREGLFFFPLSATLRSCWEALFGIEQEGG